MLIDKRKEARCIPTLLLSENVCYSVQQIGIDITYLNFLWRKRRFEKSPLYPPHQKRDIGQHLNGTKVYFYDAVLSFTNIVNRRNN